MPSSELQTARVNVTDAQQRLDVAFPDEATVAEPVLLKNKGPASVFVGSEGVTANLGYELEPGEPVVIKTAAKIYGICAATLTATVHVMQVRN